MRRHNCKPTSRDKFCPGDPMMKICMNYRELVNRVVAENNEVLTWVNRDLAITNGIGDFLRKR